MASRLRVGIIFISLVCVLSTPIQSQVADAFKGETLPIPAVIRMHVRADSDHPSDQQLKERVRDELLAALSKTPLARYDITFDQAAAFLATHREWIEETVRRRVLLEGASKEIAVEIGIFPYEARTYRDAYVPAGQYLALEIRIGSGAGQNFWCILFPGMCFVPEEVQELAQQRARGSVAEAAPLPNPGSEGRELALLQAELVWLKALYEKDAHYMRLYAPGL